MLDHLYYNQAVLDDFVIPMRTLEKHAPARPARQVCRESTDGTSLEMTCTEEAVRHESSQRCQDRVTSSGASRSKRPTDCKVRQRWRPIGRGRMLPAPGYDAGW